MTLARPHVALSPLHLPFRVEGAKPLHTVVVHTQHFRSLSIISDDHVATTLLEKTLPSLAWPVAACVLVAFLRKPLTELIPRIQSAKTPLGEVTFGERAQVLEAEAARVVAEAAAQEQGETAPADPQSENEVRREDRETTTSETTGTTSIQAQGRAEARSSASGTGRNSFADRPKPDILSFLSGSSRMLTPTEVVLGSWEEVSSSLSRTAERFGVDPRRGRSSLYQARILQAQGILDDRIASVLDELRTLRNEVAHARMHDLSPEAAAAYRSAATNIVDELRRIATQRRDSGEAPSE